MDVTSIGWWAISIHFWMHWHLFAQQVRQIKRGAYYEPDTPSSTLFTVYLLLIHFISCFNAHPEHVACQPRAARNNLRYCQSLVAESGGEHACHPRIA